LTGEHLIPTILGLGLALIGPAAVAGLSDRASRENSRLRIMLLSEFFLLALLAGILLIVVLWERESLSSIGLHPPGWQSLLWGIALALFFIYVFAPAAYRALHHLKVAGFDHGLSRLAGLPVWYLVLAVLIGGIAEEILYRGYAIERLSSIIGSYWLAGLISLLVFGLAHVPMWGFWPALTTFVSGGILTVFYIWQQDLSANIIAHVLTDFAGIVIIPRIGRAEK
jgi:membrane protease YdiL (CAAX protease family)